MGLSAVTVGTEADLDTRNTRTSNTGHSRSGSVLQGAQESRLRPENLFVQPEVAGVVFGPLLNASTLPTMWASHEAYPSPTWRTSLQFSTQKGYGF